MIKRLVGEHFTFLKKGVECRPPRWLPEAMRFASHDREE
jgi:hypothetical protein